jgi:CDGSH-type Zn-finger protein
VSAPSQTTITPYRDGPLLVRGPLRMTDQDGNEIEVGMKTVALCRCGRSQRKPFCDGTHKAAGWRAASGPEPGPGSASGLDLQAAERR